MILTLQKTEKIKIDMPRFIECILYLYRVEKSLHLRTFYDEIHYAILEITDCDIREYDNPRYTMDTIIKNAYIYAIKNNYSQADLDMLNGIMDLL